MRCPNCGYESEENNVCQKCGYSFLDIEAIMQKDISNIDWNKKNPLVVWNGMVHDIETELLQKVTRVDEKNYEEKMAEIYNQKKQINDLEQLLRIENPFLTKERKNEIFRLKGDYENLYHLRNIEMVKYKATKIEPGLGLVLYQNQSVSDAYWDMRMGDPVGLQNLLSALKIAANEIDFDLSTDEQLKQIAEDLEKTYIHAEKFGFSSMKEKMKEVRAITEIAGKEFDERQKKRAEKEAVDKEDTEREESNTSDSKSSNQKGRNSIIGLACAFLVYYFELLPIESTILSGIAYLVIWIAVAAGLDAIWSEK